MDMSLDKSPSYTSCTGLKQVRVPYLDNGLLLKSATCRDLQNLMFSGMSQMSAKERQNGCG